MQKVDKDKFIFMYEQEGFKTLNDNQRGGLLDLLGFLEADDKVTDPRWASYMLATVQHETAGTLLPIAEYGKGKGMKYGHPEPPYLHVYYGRGLTQNTWKGNYDMLTKAWNKSHPDRPVDFVKNPDLLLQMEYSYWAMSYAMRNGTYTGASLKKYFNDEKSDPLGARRIINGNDKAELIEKYYNKFLYIITSSIVESPNGNETV